MRATRVMYVENDPALRGIITSMLETSPAVEVVLSTGSPKEAVEFADLSRVDVALLDLALGVGEMNGVDLGIALRQRNSNIGIVLHSQYPLDFATERVPQDQLTGWSTLQKSGHLEPDSLVRLLRSTAKGIGQRTHANSDATPAAATQREEVLTRLSDRQRAIMGLTAAGFSAQQIAEQLSLTYEVVRQDLARSYKILVPEHSEGDDRRTQAVLAYVRLTREALWETP